MVDGSQQIPFYFVTSLFVYPLQIVALDLAVLSFTEQEDHEIIDFLQKSQLTVCTPHSKRDHGRLPGC
jgi:hypothetical protein